MEGRLHYCVWKPAPGRATGNSRSTSRLSIRKCNLHRAATAPLREVEQFALNYVRIAIGEVGPGVSGTASEINPANYEVRAFVNNAFKFCQ
jgi:hypothetical protein